MATYMFNNLKSTTLLALKNVLFIYNNRLALQRQLFHSYLMYSAYAGDVTRHDRVTAI